MECHGNAKFFFAGDTGHPQFPLFMQVGETFGGFDLAAIPIGACKPRHMMKVAPADPAEGIMIHKKICSKQSAAIHPGTFALSEKSLHDPPKSLETLKQRDCDMDLNMHAIAHEATMQVVAGADAVADCEAGDIVRSSLPGPWHTGIVNTPLNALQKTFVSSLLD
jgi:L-ascorbate metabolism protein UlaG (beta-lactamase superfamily)